MKTYTFRVPEALLDEIDAEARARGLTRSAVARERLRRSFEVGRTTNVASANEREPRRARRERAR